MDLTAAILTGLGLAGAAGLNAYIPLLMVGVLEYLGWVSFPSPYDDLAQPWILAILAALLGVEFFADKIPVVDSANDVVQTFVRPAAGAFLFAASVGVVGDVNPTFSLVAGLLTAGSVHGTKAALRPALNAGSAGTAAPVVSTIEDVVSFGLAAVAIVAPLLVILFAAMFIWLVVRWLRKRKRRRATSANERSTS